jgi:ABC-type Na+ efflux pump permease subunit
MRRKMLRDALFLAWMDLRHLSRSRETLMWTFVMPVIFFYFLGAITGNFRGGSKDTLAVSVAADAGFLADEVIARLGARDFSVVRTRTEAEFLGYGRRLEIPAGFTTSALASKPVTLHLTRIGDDMGASYDRVRVQRALNTVRVDLAALGTEAAVTPERLAELARQPRPLGVDVKAAGKRIDPPIGFEQSVPGTMVMFTLLVMFTSGAVTLTIERRNGILRRLASSSMSRGAVSLGKWGARWVMGMVQISFAMIAGSVLFHVHWGANLAAVAAILAAYGALAASLGMALGNFGRTEAQVIGLGVIASNLLAGLGGCWWPIEVTPVWLQKAALFLPTGLTMDALHKLVNFGAPPAAVIPHLCALIATALGAGYVVARYFRFQ